MLGGLLVDEAAAEQLALAGPGQAGVEGGLAHADGEGADAGPEQVEGPHRDREPLVDLAEEVVAPDADAVEVQGAERVRRHHVETLAGESRRASPATANAVTPRALAPGVVRAKTE